MLALWRVGLTLIKGHYIAILCPHSSNGSRTSDHFIAYLTENSR